MRILPSRLAPAFVLAVLLAAIVPLAFSWSSPAQASSPLLVDKRCSPEARVGGAVLYVIDITNTSGSETLTIDAVDDPLLGGDIKSNFPASLAPGQTASWATIRGIFESDPRPLINTVAVDATGSSSGALSAGDSCTTQVAHMTLTKTAAFVGADTVYTFVIKNVGSVPLMRFSVTDDVLGDLTSLFPVTLAVGEEVTVQKTLVGVHECQNTVHAIYQSTTLSTRVDARDQCGEGEPGLAIAKECIGNAVVGQTVTFRYTIQNTGAVNLTRDTVTDTLLGNITASFPATLTPSQTAVVDIPHLVTAGDPQPLTNTVTAIYRAPDNSAVTAGPRTAECAARGRLLIEKRNPDGSLWTSPAVTFYVCPGIVADCNAGSSGVITVLIGGGNPNPAALFLAPGNYTVCEVVPAGFTVAPSRCQTAAVPLGGTVTVVFTNSPEQGGEGCTPGFWKNHQSLWNQAGDAVSADVAAAIASLGAPYSGNGTTGSSFRTTFGLTAAQMTAAGLNTNLTLLQAINLGGGGFNKLARHGVAGLLSSVSVNYTYTPTAVLVGVHNAVIALTPEPFATQLAAANDLSHENCPG